MFVVKYTGPFAFIKPWTSVRDEETFSQNFLTPSIIEGIEKKLFPELLSEREYPQKIRRHRLTYAGFSKQQEQTQPRGINISKKKTIVTITRERSILNRVVLVNPILFLAFDERAYAKRAASQHICLCRNEDILLPITQQDGNLIREVTEEEFDKPDNGFNGFELLMTNDENSFQVGFNRFKNGERMYGKIHIIGTSPINSGDSPVESDF